VSIAQYLAVRVVMDEHVSRAEFERLVNELHALRAQLDHERGRRTPARMNPSARDAAAIALVGDDVEAGAHREAALSRRGLLRRVAGASALGAGLLVVGDTFAPRAAHAGTDGDVVLGASNDAGGTSRRSHPRTATKRSSCRTPVLASPSSARRCRDRA
jgi:hypothetical protein